MRATGFLAAFLILGAVSTAQAQGIPDGTYKGLRGYFRPSDPDCLGAYSFDALVGNGQIRFYSDNRYWTGTIDQDTGAVSISDSGLNPPSQYGVAVYGHFRNATLTSGLCGNGFFKIFY